MAEIRLVGTAHVSQKSIDEVREAMETFQPDIVAVELDPARCAALKKQGEEPSIADVFRSGNFTQLLVQWLLAHLQRRIGSEVGVEPGAEMKAAIEEAEQRSLPIALIDRDIRITLTRFLNAMTFIEKLRLLYALAVSMLATETEEIDVEELTRQDVMTAALDEFRRFSPRGARALIDERDAYLAHKIRMLARSHEKVLAVVGAGHVRGIQRFLEDPQSLPPLESLTADVKPRPYAKILGGLVTALFATLILALLFSGVGMEVLVAALVYWVLIHGVLCAAFALAAGGHPLSALTGFGVSWLTALNPLLAAGWFSAIVEAKIRKPTTKDFRAIMEAESLSDMRRIPLFRVVLVAALANIGSTLGTIAYFIFIFPALGIDPTVLLMDGLQNIGSLLPVP
ncbi:MAG: TraB/GumN family protein [Methanomicrobiales archaeon]|nr:TraB/GumN family protein [Methanomicrobiales archaeon]MDI6875814.1 TraB/GumN family protein [Methanomicrobiales archaeon]